MCRHGQKRTDKSGRLKRSRRRDDKKVNHWINFLYFPNFFPFFHETLSFFFSFSPFSFLSLFFLSFLSVIFFSFYSSFLFLFFLSPIQGMRLHVHTLLVLTGTLLFRRSLNFRSLFLHNGKKWRRSFRC